MENDPCLWSCVLDGAGGGTWLSPDEAAAWKAEDGVLWQHLDYERDGVREWLVELGHIEPAFVESLVSEAPRPRSLAVRDDLLIVLRGVNLNPNQDPEDMVSVRLWIGANRIVSLRHRRVMAISEIEEALREGSGPCGPGDFLITLVERLSERLAAVVSDVDDVVDDLEDSVVEGGSYQLRSTLGAARRQTIALRRYLAPQRETVARLWSERVTWLSDMHRAFLREAADRNARFVEDLDSARDRAAVTMEELANRLSEQMNQKLYLLSLVTAVFLPLGLLTGLLGINVGGMPGADEAGAFWLVSGGLIVLAAGLVWFFKRRSWL